MAYNRQMAEEYYGDPSFINQINMAAQNQVGQIERGNDQQVAAAYAQGAAPAEMIRLAGEKGVEGWQRGMDQADRAQRRALAEEQAGYARELHPLEIQAKQGQLGQQAQEMELGKENLAQAKLKGEYERSMPGTAPTSGYAARAEEDRLAKQRLLDAQIANDRSQMASAAQQREAGKFGLTSAKAEFAARQFAPLFQNPGQPALPTEQLAVENQLRKAGLSEEDIQAGKAQSSRANPLMTQAYAQINAGKPEGLRGAALRDTADNYLAALQQMENEKNIFKQAPGLLDTKQENDAVERIRAKLQPLGASGVADRLAQGTTSRGLETILTKFSSGPTSSFSRAGILEDEQKRIAENALRDLEDKAKNAALPAAEMNRINEAIKKIKSFAAPTQEKMGASNRSGLPLQNMQNGITNASYFTGKP